MRGNTSEMVIGLSLTCCFLMRISSPPTGASPRSSASCLATQSLSSLRLTSRELQSSPVFSRRDLATLSSVKSLLSNSLILFLLMR